MAAAGGLIAAIVVSVLVAGAGPSATHRIQKLEGGGALVLKAQSLLSAQVACLWVEMPKTFTHFHPLGHVLVVIVGAGVAERSGLFAMAMSAAVRRAPRLLLTPVTALVP